ncbi:hypothetical protein Trydic_g397 [Trypoxylus dichotomus]
MSLIYKENPTFREPYILPHTLSVYMLTSPASEAEVSLVLLLFTGSRSSLIRTLYESPPSLKRKRDYDDRDDGASKTRKLLCSLSSMSNTSSRLCFGLLFECIVCGGDGSR